MIVDLRVYTYFPARFRKFLKGYEDIGFALTSKHLGRTLGVFRSESGVQNRTFQFFMYRDADHRDTCRKGMLADPAWAEFVKIDGDALLQQTNTLLSPIGEWPALNESHSFDTSDPSGLRLFELRTYSLQPEAFAAAKDLIAREGFAIHERLGLATVAWFVADTGGACRLLRLTVHDNEAGRRATNGRVDTDEAAGSFEHAFERLWQSQEVELLIPLSVSPLR